MIQREKIAAELQEYQKFEKTFEFKVKESMQADGVQYCGGMPVYDANGKYISECNFMSDIRAK